MEQFFRINVKQYDEKKDFFVYRPASLNNPKSNAVMFIRDGFLKYADVLNRVSECLVFWPLLEPIPDDLAKKHAICPRKNPHAEFGRFFRDNHIFYYPQKEKYEVVDGAFVACTAEMGKDCIIMPGAYIGGEVSMGNNVYIGAGTKLVGKIKIGNNVVIRENSVIGADGLSTERDENGVALTMPQFGGVILEDDVQIGALTVIARGAIDDTVVRRGSKIDNSCFISHNVQIGEDTFIVGETIMFGSSSTGNQTYISGNSTIREWTHIGNNALIGMGSVVVKPVADNAVVKGNPAKE